MKMKLEWEAIYFPSELFTYIYKAGLAQYSKYSTLFKTQKTEYGELKQRYILYTTLKDLALTQYQRSSIRDSNPHINYVSRCPHDTCRPGHTTNIFSLTP